MNDRFGLARRKDVAWVLVAALVLGLLAAGPALAAEPASWPEVAVTKVVGGIQRPVHVTHAGDGSNRLFVVEQAGRIMLAKNGAVQPVPFLDIRERVLCCGERGLLSVAFPPNYAAKGWFYVYYIDKENRSVVARFRVGADSDLADAASEEILLTVPQPYVNHKGGQLAFGPVDGYLYIGLGDGGSAGDPGNRAQDPAQLLGKILRIDVESGAQPYAVPTDNPYVGDTTYRPEIWALGLRNPWRFSFDRLTGDLYIGDVGQSAYEEIDFQATTSAGGENYGWRILEALHCYSPSAGCVPPERYAPPVIEHAHAEQWVSITGGVVYRGRDHASLQGIYLYGDYGNGDIWGLRRAGGQWANTRLLVTNYNISTFGEDERGTVLVADYATGDIYAITAAAPTATPAPTRLPLLLPLILKH
ncbi:MAG: PQQ-dependent sugar dehydrogenase [Chloroflexi bacterium]|nr:PQQ-dependent sugar dehydrogenase [Chloroflexota bacterium]